MYYFSISWQVLKLAGSKLGQVDKDLTNTDDLEARLVDLHA